MNIDTRPAEHAKLTHVAAVLTATELGEWKRERLVELRAVIDSLRAERDLLPAAGVPESRIHS